MTGRQQKKEVKCLCSIVILIKKKLTGNLQLLQKDNEDD